MLLPWSKRIAGREPGKADGLDIPEGSSPDDAMASREDTTGVLYSDLNRNSHQLPFHFMP